ncbi:1990_t:CDS:1, partial [Acaulospora morrowiae]
NCSPERVPEIKETTHQITQFQNAKKLQCLDELKELFQQTYLESNHSNNVKISNRPFLLGLTRNVIDIKFAYLRMLSQDSH